MATILPPMQFVPAQWFTTAGDAALSGGILKFYEVGTSTPKTVYADYLRQTSIGSEVTLDAGGRATIFLDGLYRVALYDSNDVLVSGPIDGIGGGSSTTGAYPLALSYYDDLRALDGDDTRSAVLEGRTASGDGGAGLFVWDALETADDNDGTILAPVTLPASGRWVRVRDPGAIDPRWFGCAADGVTDDYQPFASALAASASLQCPIVVENCVIRIASTISAVSGASLKILPGAALTGGSGVVIGLPTGCKFEGSDNCFRGDLTASFGVLVTEIFPSWWDRTTSDEQITIALASVTAAGTKVVIDRTYSVDSNLTQGPNPILSFRGIGQLNFGTGTGLNITIQKWEQDASGIARFVFGSKARLTSIVFANDQEVYLSPRLFGAAGNGTSDDTNAVWPAWLHGWINVDGRFQVTSTLTGLSNKSIFLNGHNSAALDWTGPDPLQSEIIVSDAKNLSPASASQRIIANRVTIRRTEVGTASPSTITNLFATDCLIYSSADGNGAPLISVSGVSNAVSISDSRLFNCQCIAGIVGSYFNRSVSSGDSGTNSYTRGISGNAGSWSVYDSSIDNSPGFSSDRIFSSVITCSGPIVMSSNSSIVGSIISNGSANTAAGRIVSSGELTITGGNVSVPIIGSSGHDIFVSGTSNRLSWNGFGNLSANGCSKIGNDGDILSKQRDTMRATAVSVNGVDSPYLQRHDLTTGPAILTSSTSGWAFGATLGTPSVSSNKFVWSGVVTPATSHTMTRTITTDEEKILSAFGGYIDVEWTSTAANVSVEMLRSSDSSVQEKSGLGGLPAGNYWPATDNKMVYMVWPGSKAGSDLVDRIRVTFSSYTADNINSGITVKVTVRACAPLDVKQWVDMWGGDRSLVRRYNSWRFTQSGAAVGYPGGNFRGIECWVETLPLSPYTPRPETVQPWLLLQLDPVKLWPLMLAPNVATETFATQPIYAWKGANGAGFRTRTGGEG